MLVRKAVFIFFIAGILSVMVSATMAADNVLEREDIKTTQSEFNGILTSMREAATNAESVLENVKTMDVEAQRNATNSLFDGLKVKVNEMLEGLAPNSVLMDNLEGAKARVIVLKRWFERQPSRLPEPRSVDHAARRHDSELRRTDRSDSGRPAASPECAA